MHVRADFFHKEIVRFVEAEWVPSSQPGVTRLMLDRRGGEIARATSLVRFEWGGHFPFHVDGGGEEILVIKGLLEDEHGAYPPGGHVFTRSQHFPRALPDRGLYAVREALAVLAG